MTGSAAPAAAGDLGAVEIAGDLPAEAAASLPSLLVPYLQALHASPLGETVRSVPWVYPVLETVHVIGLGLIFGGIFLLDLRLLGVGRSLAVTALAGHVLPWVWLGFLLNMASGVLLFSSDALSLAANISFQLKMLLLIIAGITAVIFMRSTYRTAANWNAGTPTPPAAKIAALLSLVSWLGVITLGRLIAYWS